MKKVPISITREDKKYHGNYLHHTTTYLQKCLFGFLKIVKVFFKSDTEATNRQDIIIHQKNYKSFNPTVKPGNMRNKKLLSNKNFNPRVYPH